MRVKKTLAGILFRKMRSLSFWLMEVVGWDIVGSLRSVGCWAEKAARGECEGEKRALDAQQEVLDAVFWLCTRGYFSSKERSSLDWRMATKR